MSQKTDSFASFLRSWIEGKGIPAAEAGARLSVSHQTVYNWLDGSLPPSTRLPALADALGAQVEDLRKLVARDRNARRRLHTPRRTRGGAA